jgi:hypothetical protein
MIGLLQVTFWFWAQMCSDLIILENRPNSKRKMYLKPVFYNVSFRLCLLNFILKSHAMSTVCNSPAYFKSQSLPSIVQSLNISYDSIQMSKLFQQANNVRHILYFSLKFFPNSLIFCLHSSHF